MSLSLTHTHTLSLYRRWMEVSVRGETHYIHPLLITGLKAWHLRPVFSLFFPFSCVVISFFFPCDILCVSCVAAVSCMEDGGERHRDWGGGERDGCQGVFTHTYARAHSLAHTHTHVRRAHTPMCHTHAFVCVTHTPMCVFASACKWVAWEKTVFPSFFFSLLFFSTLMNKVLNPNR